MAKYYLRENGYEGDSEKKALASLDRINREISQKDLDSTNIDFFARNFRKFLEKANANVDTFDKKVNEFKASLKEKGNDRKYRI